MKVKFLEARYKGKITLPEELIKKLPEKVMLYTTVQYLDLIDNVKEQLIKNKKKILNKNYKKLIHTKYHYQILGCSVEKINIDFDAFLYVGDGTFHPKALVLLNKKPCYCYNPKSKEHNIITEQDTIKIQGKQRALIIKFLESTNIGIIISTKPGQNYNINKLKELEKQYKEKKFYYFLSDTITPSNLENFNYIEIFINTACYRIAIDDYSLYKKPIININDLLRFLNK